MKKYDVIIPLGEFCATAVALRDSGIRKNSYPFDWSVGIKHEICGNCGFMGKIKMICNDFKDAFNLEDLSEFWTPQPNHRSVINNRTGLQYLHDFVYEKPIDKFYPEWLEKYQRRVQRLYDDINNNNNVLFVFVTRAGHILALEEICLALEMLNKKFPNKNIDFLLIQDSIDCSANEIKYFKINDNLHMYLYRDFVADLGNQSAMKRCLTEYIKGEVEYNFATDNVKNYGLSIKENWGRWSDGHDVYMSIPVNFDNDITVDFDLWPYVVEQHTTQDVDVFLDDKKIASWHFEFGQNMPQTTLNIPKNKSGHIMLYFKIKNPVSLLELNRGEDNRKLGIGFKKMKITEIQVPDNII